jgi:hypothetical protein
MHQGLTHKVSLTRLDDMHREATRVRVANQLRRQARSSLRRWVPKRLFTSRLRERLA